MNSLNRFFDTLPKSRLGRGYREVPAFRTCGVVGFYVAVIVTLGGGLVGGRSLTVLAGVCIVCAISFFVYTYIRKWITGHESLVLLEHVWFALACTSTFLWVLGEPILMYLDVTGVGLCEFLAAGRVGCTLVGCCHGQPSSIGIVYTQECARDGFAGHLVGVRLFPVPAIEGIGLTLIGVAGFVALPFARPGLVFVWFLLAYSVMRFGLEGLRGDPRPHWFGLSQARWMSIVEVGCALRLAGGAWSTSPAIYGLLLSVLVLALILRRRYDLRPSVLERTHIAEARQLLLTAAGSLGANCQGPVAHTTSRGVTLAVSTADGAGVSLQPSAHVSFSLPGCRSDLALLSELAARVVSAVHAESARFTSGSIFQVTAPWPNGREWPTDESLRYTAHRLYGSAARDFQRATSGIAEPVQETSSTPVAERSHVFPSTCRHHPAKTTLETNPDCTHESRSADRGKGDSNSDRAAFELIVERRSVTVDAPSLWHRLATQRRLPTDPMGLAEGSQETASTDSNNRRAS